MFWQKKAPVEYPVFNLEVKRDKAGFISSDLLREIDQTSEYIGEFIVQSSGRLNRGRDPSLHIYETSIEYCDNHIHTPSGWPVDMTTIKGDPGLDSRFENQVFTLRGFYSHNKGRGSPDIQEKLIDKIQKSDRKFQFNSIAKHKETRIKLLEHQYKKHVSDQ